MKYTFNLLAQIIHDGFKHENRPGGSKNGQWLPREKSIGDANEEARDEGLDGGNIVTSGIAQHPAKGDDGSQARKVDEDVGGN